MDRRSKIILTIGIIAIFFAIVISSISIIVMTTTLKNSNGKKEVEYLEYPIEETVNYELESPIIGTLPSNEDPDKVMNISIEVGFKLDANNKKTEDILLLMQENEGVISDRISKILENKTLESMQEKGSTEKLQNEILETISNVLNTNTIVEVYFGKNLKSIK